MTTLMQDAATWLGSRLQETAGRTVTYARSPSVKHTPTAVRKQRIYRGTKDGVYTQVVSVDWLIESSDLSGLEPRRGDTITDSSDAKYEVLPVLDMPCWEYFDQANSTMTIHTKRVA